MQMFFFLVAAIVLIYVLSTFLLPLQQDEEEEEDELWDAAELRLESLLQGVMDPRNEVRERYCNRILSMGASVIPRLTEALSQELFLDHHTVRIERLKGLVLDFGLQAVSPLLDLLEEEGGDPAVAAAVQELLLALGPRALPQIIQRLGFPIAMPLLPVLQVWGLSSIKAALKGLRRRPNESFWRRVFLALGHEAIPLLSEAVDSWQGPAREGAFLVYASFGPADGHQLFRKELASPRPLMRIASLQALAQIADPTTFEDILLLLHDPQQDVRINAIEALPQVDKVRAIKPLLSLLEDLDAEGRVDELLTTAVCLGQLRQKVSLAHVDLALHSTTWRFRAQGIQLLRCLPSSQQEQYLERLLWDDDDRMVHEAVVALGSLATVDAIDALLRFAADGHSTRPCMEWIETALCQMHSDSAIRAIAHSLQNDELRGTGLALRALLQSDHPAALEPILECLEQTEDPDAEWGIEPQDLHVYLQRIATRCELKTSLLSYLQQHELSPLGPAIKAFLAQLSPLATAPPPTALEGSSPDISKH